MRFFTISMILVAQLALSDSCLEYYNPEQANQSHFSNLITFVKDQSSEIAQACQAGAAACSNGLSLATGKVVDTATFNFLVAKKLGLKIPTKPFEIAFFSIEAEKIKDTIVKPIVTAMTESKEAQTKLIRIANGLSPQAFQPASWLAKFSRGHLGGNKNPKTDQQIIEELNKKVLDSEVELWAHAYYSMGLIGLVGLPKLKADSPVRIATRVVLTSDLIPTVLPAVGLAQQVIMKAMIENFKSTSDQAMVERLRLAIKAGFKMKGHEDLQTAADIIFDQFGFNELMAAIDQSPSEAALIPLAIK